MVCVLKYFALVAPLSILPFFKIFLTIMYLSAYNLIFYAHEAYIKLKNLRRGKTVMKSRGYKVI